MSRKSVNVVPCFEVSSLLVNPRMSESDYEYGGFITQHTPRQLTSQPKRCFVVFYDRIQGLSCP